MRQTSDEFLDVANALYTSDRRSESGIIPEEQVKTVELSVKLDITWESGYLRIVKALPFFFCEKLAEFGVPNSNSLRLHSASTNDKCSEPIPRMHRVVA